MDPVLSPEGAAFIGAWEGFIEHCYDDSRGNCTVGIGHLVHMGATTQADRDHWGTLSLPHAIALLQADAHRNGLDALEASVTVQLTQGQVNALVSLCFNCGPGALASGHAVATAVNSKPARWNPLDMKAWRTRVSDAIMLWANPPELTRRRQSEAFLFRTGKYTKATGNPHANA